MPRGDEIVKGARARGRDEASEQALAAAFDKGGAERVTQLYWRDDLPSDGEIAGVVALAPGDAPDTLNLEQAVRRAAPYPQRRRPGATRARRRRGAAARRRAADDPG